MRTDQGGHLFTAINRSDRDLVVRVESNSPVTLRLPAHTKGTLSSSWDYFASWRMTVLDGSCAMVASIPVAGQGTVLTIKADGTLIADEDRLAFSNAPERWDTDLRPADCPTSR